MDMPPPQYTVVKDTLEGSGSPDVNTSAIPTTSNGIEQDRPLNVLILGEMANGKSTLIRQLKVYAGSDNPDIGIGFGNVACTKEVGRYPLSTSLRSYCLQDMSGRKIKKGNFTDFVDFTDDDAVVVEDQKDDGGKVINFQLIDTPGLDDSDGNDMEIMTEIIAKIDELTHLNAVIYVRHMSKPFGSAFTRFYEYIQRCMPMISNGLIVVHTGFTVEKIDEALSAKRDLASEREAAFTKATKGQMSLAHFFMDNNPDDTNPFAVCESLNGAYKLLKFLSTQLPLDISGLKLLKAPNMANFDTHVLLALERHHRKLKTRLEAELAAESKSKQKMMRTRREIARIETKREEYEKELDHLDRPNEIILGTKTVAEDYGLKQFLLEGALWLDKRDVHFDSDCTISRVQKSTGNGCKWLNEDLRGTSWRANLTSGILRSMEGTATFYTTRQIKHSGEIQHLREGLKDMAYHLRYHEHELQDMDPLDEANKATEQLAGDVDRCSNTIERIQKDSFEAHLWPLLRRFYISHGAPSKSDLVEFVEVYDPLTAETLINF